MNICFRNSTLREPEDCLQVGLLQCTVGDVTLNKQFVCLRKNVRKTFGNASREIPKIKPQTTSPWWDKWSGSKLL